jgi:hypothetical protein
MRSANIEIRTTGFRGKATKTITENIARKMLWRAATLPILNTVLTQFKTKMWIVGIKFVKLYE